MENKENIQPKFTPGPWYCTDLGQIGKTGYKKHPICLASFHWAAVGNDEEMMANAKLATAAPEMYEVLKMLVKWNKLREKAMAPLATMDKINEIAMRVLAKASGEDAE